MTTRIAAFLFLLCATEAAHAQSRATISADNSGWQQVEQKNGIAIYSRGRPGTSLKEFKGVGAIAAPPYAIENVLQDIPNYTRFMPYVSEARVISQDGAKAVVYQRLDIPFVNDRDYTLRVEHGTEPTPNGMIYLDTWQIDNGAGPAERRGTVRVKVDEGSWLLEPSGSNATHATYRIYTDSGGALPAFVGNHAAQTAIPKLFDALRNQVKDPKYATPAPAPQAPAANAAAAAASPAAK